MEQLSTIKIGDKEYFIKCNLDVCEGIQDEFGTLVEFERKIKGLKKELDKEGNPVKNEDGNEKYEATEPSIKALKYAIGPFVTAGAEATAEKIDRKALEKAVKNFEFDRWAVSLAITKEFLRCLTRKNP